MPSTASAEQADTSAPAGGSEKQSAAATTARPADFVTRTADCKTSELRKTNDMSREEHDIRIADEKTTGEKQRPDGKRNWRKRNRKRKGLQQQGRRPRPYPRPSREWDGDKTGVNHSLNLDQEQEKRANFVKMSMQKYGKPYAPYNTTQFLMEDHNVREPEFEEINKLLRLQQDQQDNSNNMAENESFSTRDGSDSEDFYSSPDDEQDFQQKQFSEAYEHVHAERISSMSKAQLVQEYILLEGKAEDLEKKLKATQGLLSEIRSRAEPVTPPAASFETAADIVRLQTQIKRLTEENERLRYASHPPSSSSHSSCSNSSVIADSCTHPEAIPTSTSSAS